MTPDDTNAGAVGSPVERPVRPLDLDAIRFLASGQDDPQSIALRECAAELWTLRRWKSTHAPRLATLEALHRKSQADAEAGREAVATLASERAANAVLTGEVERLRTALLAVLEDDDHDAAKSAARAVLAGIGA